MIVGDDLYVGGAQIQLKAILDKKPRRVLRGQPAEQPLSALSFGFLEIRPGLPLATVQNHSAHDSRPDSAGTIGNRATLKSQRGRKTRNGMNPRRTIDGALRRQDESRKRARPSKRPHVFPRKEARQQLAARPDQIDVGTKSTVGKRLNTSVAFDPLASMAEGFVDLQSVKSYRKDCRLTLKTLRCPKPDDLSGSIEQDRISKQLRVFVRAEKLSVLWILQRRLHPASVELIDRHHTPERRTVEHRFVILIGFEAVRAFGVA